MKILRKEITQIHETKAGSSDGSIQRKIKKADVSHDHFKRELEKSLGRKPEEKAKNQHLSALQIIDLLKVQINEHIEYLARKAGGSVPLSAGTLEIDSEIPQKQGDEILSAYQNTGSFDESDYLEDIIRDASKKYHIDSNLIKAVIKVESDFHTKSTSSKGAMGLMQLMPETAREMGVKNPYDARENVMGGRRISQTAV
ncbi:MAG: lytic transglycosylase domain-containing protein [Syntrophales bacterium]|jgi:hypothetical protein|nr:lytic transglycosylase domain-containing protein [Syntrophales bacterium]MDY0044921.1 lytic transglycosylase domain-containing protein [Syntrophales bacterium]